MIKNLQINIIYDKKVAQSLLDEAERTDFYIEECHDDRVNSLARKNLTYSVNSMSIGEWISLYENNEIDIHPEFQRIFRWTSSQKTSLIESILLGIPIPPIFVSQRDDGVWDADPVDFCCCLFCI